MKTAEDIGPIINDIHVLIKYYVDSGDKTITNTEFPLIDYIFEKLDIQKLSVLELITWIRTTVPIKTKLKHWESFRDKAYDHCTEIGEDSDRIFTGLF